MAQVRMDATIVHADLSALARFRIMQEYGLGRYLARGLSSVECGTSSMRHMSLFVVTQLCFTRLFFELSCYTLESYPIQFFVQFSFLCIAFGPCPFRCQPQDVVRFTIRAFNGWRCEDFLLKNMVTEFIRVNRLL